MSNFYLISRDPMPVEREAIKAILEGYDPPIMAIFDHYISDSPGYTGWLAMTVGGEPQYCNTFTKDKDGVIELCVELEANQ